MQLLVDSVVLATELNAPLAVASSPGVLPLLSHILLEASPEGLTITATDLEATLRVEVVADVERTGSALLPAKVFCDAVRCLEPDPRCMLRLDRQSSGSGKGRLTIESGGSAYRLVCANPAEFPSTPRGGRGEGAVEVPAAALARALTRALPVAGAAGGLGLRCLQLRAAKGGVMALGTDGHRVAVAEEVLPGARRRVPAPGAETAEPMLVAARGARLLLDAVKGRTDSVTISESQCGNHFALTFGAATLYLKKVATEYPDCLAALPDDRPGGVAVRVSRQLLTGALKRCAVLAKERATAVDLEWHAATRVLTITLANPDLGASVEQLQCAPDGVEGGGPVRSNVKYLLEALDSLSDFEEVELAWDDRMVSLRPAADEEPMSRGLIVAAAIHKPTETAKGA